MTTLGDLVLTGIHPYADRWPMRTPDELEAMAESIRANGLRFPIVLTPEGVLVDGRNRLRACEIAGVEPGFETRGELVTDEQIVAFIWDANGDRRDMSKGAKAMLWALRPGAAVVLSTSAEVSHSFISRARQVIEFCDEELVSDVIADRLSLNDAYTQAQQIKATVQAEEIARRKAEAEAKKEAERQAQLLATLTDKAPDLAALVDNGTMPLSEALAACDARFAAERRAEALHAEKVRKLNRDFSAKTYLLAALGEYPERLAELLDLWNTAEQPYPVTEQMIQHAIDGLNAVAQHIRSTQ